MRPSPPKCLSLVKGPDRFVWWYEQGQESALLSSLAETAEDPRTDFDFDDAATLGYAIGKLVAPSAT
jgi:hypothetical protein